jgi:pSer/pThr/pTyr-binding forkhead associated (FHA) protein
MTAAVKAPSGRTIWKAVRDELMLNLYPMPFSTIAPAIYHVYLHPDDFAAIEGLSARIVAQIQQALTAEVERVNHGLGKSARRVLTRLLDRDELPAIELPAGGWEVHLCADGNDELERGQLGIVSTLAMPAPAEYAGTPTTRIVRSVVGSGRRSISAREESPAAPPSPVTAPGSRGLDPRDTRERARLTYEDEQGPHVFLMRKDAVSIGRGGSSAWVDVQIVTSSRVSREHLRLRLDPHGQFFVQDVSLWGTQVDGQPIPPAVKSAEGVSQPGPEHPLPSKARIGLAETIVIQFEALTGP